jgi:hypothetical protein
MARRTRQKRQKSQKSQKNQKGGGAPIVFQTERYTRLNEHPHRDNIIGVASDNRRFLPLDTLSKFIPTRPPGNTYVAAADNYASVTTYSDLQRYIANYVQNSDRSPYGTIINPSPLNAETMYIQPELLAFIDKGYIPFDSQIGCVTYDTEGVITLNRPYIQLMMTRARFAALQGLLRAHPILCEVPREDETKSILSNISMADKEEYRTMYIGMPGPGENTGPSEIGYICSNRFFHDLLTLISTIGGRRRNKTRRSRRFLS